jgi:hypothetical protein
LEFFKLGGQGREQMLFGRKHRARFYGVHLKASGIATHGRAHLGSMSSGLPVIRLGIVVLDEIDPELYWLVTRPLRRACKWCGMP